MATTIETTEFRNALDLLFTEVFEEVQGFILDRGDSMFETLATITADEASQRVSSQGACLAAQVNHVRFYIDAILEGPKEGGHDWDSSWAIESVTDEEWKSLIERLKASLEQARNFGKTWENWDTHYIGGAFALIAHSAYHLGEIRAGIAVIRDRKQ